MFSQSLRIGGVGILNKSSTGCTISIVKHNKKSVCNKNGSVFRYFSTTEGGNNNNNNNNKDGGSGGSIRVDFKGYKNYGNNREQNNNNENTTGRRRQGMEGQQHRQRYNKFREDRRPTRPYKDPETGFFEGGRLNLCFTGQPNSGLVPLDMRDEIYRLHKKDPDGEGSIERQAAKTGLPMPKIQGIIKLREHELNFEKEHLDGGRLDQTLDLEARKIFGEKRSWLEDIKEREDELRKWELGKNRQFYFTEALTDYPGFWEIAREFTKKEKERIKLRALGTYRPWKPKMKMPPGEKKVKSAAGYDFRKIVR